MCSDARSRSAHDIRPQQAHVERLDPVLIKQVLIRLQHVAVLELAEQVGHHVNVAREPALDPRHELRAAFPSLAAVTIVGEQVAEGGNEWYSNGIQCCPDDGVQLCASTERSDSQMGERERRA